MVQSVVTHNLAQKKLAHMHIEDNNLKVYSNPGFFFDRAKKTQGRKNSKLKEKTQNSSKKLKDSANFSVIYCKKSTEITKKQSGNN